MPTYEYKCKACDHRFDQFQSMKDGVLRKCPKCGKTALERLIGTGAAVIFKGSGFYQTDYRSDSYKKSAKAESDSSKPAAAPAPAADSAAKPAKTADSGGGDSKPAPAKPESKPSGNGKKPKRKGE